MIVDLNELSQFQIQGHFLNENPAIIKKPIKEFKNIVPKTWVQIPYHSKGWFV